MWKMGETCAEGEKNVDEKVLVRSMPIQKVSRIVLLVLIERKKAEREAQDAQGLIKNCRSIKSVSPLSRLIIKRGFRNKYHWSFNTPWEDQCEWHRMPRMTAPDCAVMCNFINTHAHT